MNYLKKTAVCIAAILTAANSLGYMPYNPVGLPVLTAEAADIVASGECGAEGDNVKWQLDSEGTLTISGEGAMPDHWCRVEQIPWYTQNTFSKVVIEEGVTDIGNFAFAECKNLSSVTIPASVKSVGGGAFYLCENLSEITLPEGIESIPDNTFKGCKSLKSIVLPDSITAIGYSAFEDCTSLEEMTIPESVNIFAGSAFNNSLWLKKQAEKNPIVIVNNILISGKTCEGKVVIPDTVTSINEEAFSENTDMTEIVIPDNVKSIGDHAFYSCGSLETITLPDTDIKIGNFVFNGCDKLVSVSLPDSITALPTGMFGNCHNLESIVIPDTVTEIGEVCFNNCHKLKEIVIQDSVKTIGSAAFENCADLTSITIENPECTIYDSETTISNTAEIRGYANSTAQAYAEKYSRTFAALDEKSAAEIVASGECGAEGYELTWSLDSKGTLTISGTGEMDSWALNSPWSEHSDKITKVIIENGVTTIGEQAFSGCEKIAEITIPDSVTNIKTGAFFDCTGLTSIKIPESVTEMGHSAFYGCVNLKEVTLPSGVGTINIGVFRDCQSLETITFSKNVKKVDFTALCGCSNLKSVIFEHPGCKIADAEHTICNSHDFDTEENVFNGTIYGYENSTAQAYAEKYNRKFVALEGKPAIEVIDSGECGGMEEDGISWMFDSEGTLTISGAWGGMYFHDNNIPWRNYQKDIVKVVVEKGVTGIEVAAFSYCTNLKSVTISDDVMYIGPYAFCGCTSLESIVIPDGVTDIEYSTFRDCVNLTSVTLPESIIEIGHSAFEGCEKLASITLKNPECVIDDVENTIPDTTVIYGCENSEVQAYAEKYNIKFVALDEKPAVEIVASGECGAEGDNVTWKLDGEGTLTISGTGEMSTTYFGEQELGKDENGIIPVDIKKVVIEDGVTSISGTAFNGYRMNEIEIADSVTSIGKFAFYNCPNLTEITLPKNLKEISLYAFTDCTALENITIPASVAVIGENPFYGCTSLNKIIVEDNNSDYVSVDGVLYTKDMTRIISYPIGKTLTEYNVPYTVKEIGGGAFGCETDLTNITIPDSVTYIGEEAFSKCNGITSITIPKNVANIGEYTFFKCAALEKIVIENPDCAIYDYSYTICNTAKSLTGADSKYQGNYDGTIYGYPNSTAQAYAEKYNIKFVALEDNPAAVVLGDVNEDGKVDSSDASLVLEEYAVIQTGGAGAFTENQKKAADVNNDSKTDSSDASKILEYYAMISTGKEPSWD